MANSLLLGLLETQEANEPDRIHDYLDWIGAQWDGKEWTNGSPERQDLMLRELYDALQSIIAMKKRPSGDLGTVLAKTLTDDPGPGLSQAARRLRAELRSELLRRFDALIATHSPLGTRQVSSSRTIINMQSMRSLRGY
jgi:hypothetical protein